MTDYAQIRETLDRLEAAGITAPSHDLAATIVAEFPALEWQTGGVTTTAWTNAYVSDDIELAAFVGDELTARTAVGNGRMLAAEFPAAD